MAPPTAPRLHVGCGRHHLSGWVNIDRQPLPGVDRVLDVTRELPFVGAEAIFAEHFLEHLEPDEALRFLALARAALAPDGWLRLSTPNLDWVLATHYGPLVNSYTRAEQAVILNRAFHAWGHRFAWNLDALALALEASGFDRIRQSRYGASELPCFAGIERHETYEDVDELPHVLIVEAARGEARPDLLWRVRRFLADQYLPHLDRP
jgi:hypothetical protein